MAKLTLQQTLDKSLKTAKQYIDTELAKKANTHNHNYLPLTGGTVTGDIYTNQYLGINAWSGYGTGNVKMWYDGTNKILDIDGATNINLDSYKVYHTGNKPTPADIGAMEAISWDCPIKGATWSRLFQFSSSNATTGGAFLVNIRATRSNVVYNPTLLVNFSHATKCKIVQLNNTEYTNIKVRGVVDSDGAGYFEIYDDANSATSSTTQTVSITVTKISGGLTITKYTAFTTGATIPSNYSSQGEMTTVSGAYYSGTAAKANTATTWQTSRTLTIGNTGKAVNGSADVSWSLAEIGAAAASHGTHLTLGTGSGNAYRGDYGNTAYTHSQAAHAPSNAQKNSDITKTEIENKLTGTISSHMHDFITSVDTRSANSAPNTYTTRGIFPEFKSTSTVGLPNSGKNFAGVITYQQWSDTTNWSGGKATQFATIDDGRMYFRKGDGSGWGAWNQIYTNLHKPELAELGAAAASHGTHLTIGTGASNAAAGNHTHNYAGSSSSGGAATSANILNINNTETKNTGRLQYFQKNNDSTIMPDTGWWSLLRTQHAGYDNGYWQEMAYSFASDTIKFRRNVNGTKSAWKTVAWTDHNHVNSYVSKTTSTAARAASLNEPEIVNLDNNEVQAKVAEYALYRIATIKTSYKAAKDNFAISMKVIASDSCETDLYIYFAPNMNDPSCENYEYTPSSYAVHCEIFKKAANTWDVYVAYCNSSGGETAYIVDVKNFSNFTITYYSSSQCEWASSLSSYTQAEGWPRYSW